MVKTAYRKNNHCSYCGHPFAVEQPWPRTCDHCANISFLNPLPVAVVIIPVDDGVLAVRRGIPPRQGQLALPGGYIDIGESWQQAGAREAYEEVGVTIDPASIQVLQVSSTNDNAILIFGVAAPLRLSDLPPFVASPEASERVILAGPTELAFPLHTEALTRFFKRQKAA